MTRRRFFLAGVVVAATLATLTVPVSRYAVWNATASVPTGLYAIRGKESLHDGERIAIEPPLERPTT
jgi:type IV secretory pathway protease TraF